MSLIFLIHSASICLLVGAVNPLTFKEILDMYVPIAILLILSDFFFLVGLFSSLLLLSCDLKTKLFLCHHIFINLF